MNALEEFERIKKYYEETNNISFEDINILINIINTLKQKSIQDSATIKYYLNSQYGKEVTDNINKVQLSSLYGEYKKMLN